MKVQNKLSVIFEQQQTFKFTAKKDLSTEVLYYTLKYLLSILNTAKLLK